MLARLRARSRQAMKPRRLNSVVYPSVCLLQFLYPSKNNLPNLPIEMQHLCFCSDELISANQQCMRHAEAEQRRQVGNATITGWNDQKATAKPLRPKKVSYALCICAVTCTKKERARFKLALSELFGAKLR